jgi:hypothetical protein
LLDHLLHLGLGGYLAVGRGIDSVRAAALNLGGATAHSPSSQLTDAQAVLAGHEGDTSQLALEVFPPQGGVELVQGDYGPPPQASTMRLENYWSNWLSYLQFSADPRTVSTSRATAASHAPRDPPRSYVE